jgi:DNA polymerase III delta prime subunit
MSTALLSRSLQQLSELIHDRLQGYFRQGESTTNAHIKAVSEHAGGIPLLASFEPHAQTVLLLAMAPHIQPNFFETIIQQYLPQGGDFPEFGGVKGNHHRGMLPTGETALFLLAGHSLDERIQVQQLFSDDHPFYQQDILWLENVREGEPQMSGRIILSQEWLDNVLLGKAPPPRFSADFPAKRLHTQMTWEDTVLHPITREQIHDIRIWLEHQHRFQQDGNLFRKIKPGYRALFYGPSGTGKTLTATLLGQQFRKEVYRIDLSQVVSKYIGETEKNLEKVFNRAVHKDWILFFDEADALFGKRTNIQSAHDRFANQEVSYLLQRVEDFPGLLILASNFKNNLDDAFLRRFHATIHFPRPNVEERLMLWQKSMPQSLEANGDIDLRTLAERFELTGASIINIMQYAALQTFARHNGHLQLNDIMEGIRKEFLKEEKSL